MTKVSGLMERGQTVREAEEADEGKGREGKERGKKTQCILMSDLQQQVRCRDSGAAWGAIVYQTGLLEVILQHLFSFRHSPPLLWIYLLGDFYGFDA